jgi:membrane protease YdiL (CAAX protease family)
LSHSLASRERAAGGMRARALLVAPGPLETLLVLLSVWTALLLVQTLLAPHVGHSLATVTSFGIATAIVLATLRKRGGAISGRVLLLLALGAAAGFASYAAWVSFIAEVGTSVGLRVPSSAIAESGAAFAVSSLLLAPLFEELLYRRRLQAVLADRYGALAAILLSSAAFAVAHVEPWAILGTFLVGLMLGSVMWLSGRVSICIGLHAGLNIPFAFAAGSPAPPPLPGALLGALLLAVAIGLSRPWPADA